jgi:hypothetical protein
MEWRAGNRFRRPDATRRLVSWEQTARGPLLNRQSEAGDLFGRRKERNMKGKLLQVIAGAVVVAILTTSGARPQTPTPTQQAQTVQQFTPEQLDQMLAPIALYPDGVLLDVLMAATYPLEVVEADRWLQEGKNASLKGSQLTAALKAQTWDPSVKSIVPYPRVLHMMDAKIEWTERLGEAFLADQAAIMDSIQRLRGLAQSSGALVSSPQAEVTTSAAEITIEPPSPETVNVPVCDPSLVYGTWPYPDYPPDYFPDFFGGAAIGGFGCGWFAVPIIEPLWGWRRWNWSRHRIDIDHDRFAALKGARAPVGEGVFGARPPVGQDASGARRPVGEGVIGARRPVGRALDNRPRVGEGAWRYDQSHRHLVAYRDPVLRAQFPRPEAARLFRLYSASVAPQVDAVHRGLAAPTGVHAWPTGIAPPVAAASRAAPPFGSFGRGPDRRLESGRGYSSGMSTAWAPGGFGRRFAPLGAAPHFAPAGGARIR